MSIKRWSSDSTKKIVRFDESDEGSWVKYDDHAAEVARLDKIYGNMLGDKSKYAESLELEVARLNEQVRALSADNLSSRNAVQAFCDVVQSNTEAISEEIGADGVRIILAAMSATGNMPATDAILNEVRAQAVDAFSAELYRVANEHVENGRSKKDVVNCRAAAKAAEDYAARIRASEVPNA